MKRPSPAELYEQARREHLHDGPKAIRSRYRELMIEYGHLVPKDHPDAGPAELPCGWRP